VDAASAEAGAREVGTAEADLVAISLDALVVTDAAGRILTANPATAELLNVRSAEVVGRLLVNHVDPSYRRSFRAYVERAGRGEHVRFSCGIVPRGLQPVPVRARVGPVRGGLGWVLRDETQARLDEASSDAGGIERLRLGRVLEGVRDGVIVVGADLCVIFANAPAKAMLAPHDLEPERPIPDPWPTSIRALVVALLEQDADNAEALVDVDERTAYWIRVYRSGAEGVVVVISDVSIEERRDQAERDFVANAAHQLQSPLTAIANAVEVLLTGAHEDEAARLRFLKHVERENGRLSRLLASLLVLAQAQATEGGIELEPVPLRPLLVDAARIVGPQNEINVSCPRGLLVLGHRGLLEHAVHNLVANALRHGSSRVLVSARSSEGRAVTIDVTDFGPGMTKDERARAFDRFFRGEARRGEGFGLGLSIVRQVARALGGEAELRPNPRGGTIARLRLRGVA
jgi:PAS domain S-box-containing protein